MRFFSTLSLCLTAGTVIASNLTPRDGSGNGRLADLISPISTTINTMIKTVQGFDGDVLYAAGILTDYEKLTAIMKTAISSMKTMQPQPEEVVLMLKPGSQLIQDVTSLMDALIQKHDLFEQQGLAFVVQDNLEQGRTLYKDMMVQIVTLVPKRAMRVFNSIGKQFAMQMDRGVVAFGGTADLPAATEEGHGAAAAPAAGGMAGMDGMAAMGDMTGHHD